MLTQTLSGFLRVQGADIVDGDGKLVILKGVRRKLVLIDRRNVMTQ
jgi:hypothetical protein